MPEARATADGTARYAARLSTRTASGNFREAIGVRLSSLGVGTYLGEENDEDDRRYQEAVTSAIRLGVNVVDTAINYRCQRSERAIGRALSDLVSRGEIARDEIVIATKGGYLAFEEQPPMGRQELADYVQRTFIAPGVIGPGELVAGVHCMSPAYLRDQIRRSLTNLGVSAIDVYYLHNPEQQLSEVPRAEFERRIRAAFETLEEAAAEGRIGVYGTATWNGYRANPESRGYLSLASLIAIAREIGGEKHRFRVVQLPYNLGMHEAFTLANQKLEVDGRTGWTSFLEAARGFGITVMASASMLQGRLAHGLPEELEQAFPGLDSDAQRAIQFVRSTPGITTALVGMKQPAHVEENLGLLGVSPAPEKHVMKLFQSASRQKGT